MTERGSVGSPITISVREIVAQTGIPRGTVARSIERLVVDGWIERLKSSSHTQHAHRYQVLKEPAWWLAPSFLWSKHGLGATAGTIYQCLSADGWSTVKQLVEAAGCSPSAVRTALLALHSAGLIDGRNPKDDSRPVKREWRRLDDADYFHWYEAWLTGTAQADTVAVVKKEQAQWAFTESQRFRERWLSPDSTDGGTCSQSGASGKPPKHQAEVA